MRKTLNKSGLMAILAAGVTGAASAGFVWDSFESYTVNAGLSGNGQWGASDNGVIVTTNIPGNATKVASLPSLAVATNTVGQTGLSGKVWTDYLVAEAVRVDTASLPVATSGAMVMVGVTTDGYAVVYNPASNGWDVCARDALGGSLAGVASGAWAEVSVCQDFGATNVAVFLNGRLLRQGIPFITSATAYSGIRFKAGCASTGYVDNVYVSNAVPSALTNLALTAATDLDGDGVPDYWEIQAYGNLTTWCPVISNTTALTIPSLTLNNLTVTNGAILTVSVPSLTVTGTMTVASGSSTLITGGTVTYSNLVIGAGATVQVTGGTLTANGVTMTGTFTLDSGWNGAPVVQALNYTNDFETYGIGQPLDRCGEQGWGASSPNSVVQGLVKTNGAKAAQVVACSSLSNAVSAVGLTKVWTDVYLQDSSAQYPGLPYPATNANRAVVLFINTNNHVVIWNSNAWDECLLDVASNSIPAISTGQWVRISVFEDFPAQKAAVFVNGRLVRQQVSFVSQVDSYHGFGVSAGSGSAYVDDVRVWTNVPPGVTNYGGTVSDLNHNGMADAFEIQQYGVTLVSLCGSVLHDLNGNGLADAGDTNGLAGAHVTLSTNGVALLTNATDNAGCYSFANLLPGTYRLVETDPTNPAYASTTTNTVTVPAGQGWFTNNFLDTLTGVGLAITADCAYAVSGQWVTNTYVVTNSGECALTNVVVTDNGTPVATNALMLAGTATNFTRVSQITATRTNVAVVSGLPSFTNGVPLEFVAGMVSATNDVIVQVVHPGFTLTKLLTAPANGQALRGETVVFTITMANTGDVRLVAAPVTDIFDTQTLGFLSGNPAPAINGGALAWEVGPMEPGVTTNLAITFVAVGTTMPGVATNLAVSTPATPGGYPVLAPVTNRVLYQIQVLEGSVFKIR